MPEIRIGRRVVGDGRPVFVVAELGINHNGSLEIAKQLIDAAVAAGCDAVKFQKRTPEFCVPEAQKLVPRETPWGILSYLDYRRKIEFGKAEYDEIDRHCRSRGVLWFASSWDPPSVDFLECYDPCCHKIPSACLNDRGLLTQLRRTGRPLIVSTGMSTIEDIRAAITCVDKDRILLTHTTSTYPCAAEEINLKAMVSLRREFGCPVGYSGHEVGLQVSLAAAALGACLIERHMTLDRAMWGTDQAASIEPDSFRRLVRDIRVIEKALGDGVKRVFPSERPVIDRLRKAPGESRNPGGPEPESG